MKYAIITLIVLLLAGAGSAEEIDPSICNPGTEISYYSSGRLKSCALGDDYEIFGVNCNQHSVINLYETGTLQSCVNRDYFKYDQITCYSRISFFPTGKLDTCDLFEAVQIDGKSCVEFQPISFFENGKLKACGAPP